MISSATCTKCILAVAGLICIEPWKDLGFADVVEPVPGVVVPPPPLVPVPVPPVVVPVPVPVAPPVDVPPELEPPVLPVPPLFFAASSASLAFFKLNAYSFAALGSMSNNVSSS